jgi:endoglucanase
MRALLLLIAVSTAFPASAWAAPPAPVAVDQHGYAPSEPKWVAVGASAASFQVLRAADGSVALSGPLTLRRASDPASGDNVYQGDFSALSETGAFYVHVPGVGDSPTFTIQPGNYDDLYKRLLRGLYYQRCGTDIPAAFGGAGTHGVCHASGALCLPMMGDDRWHARRLSQHDRRLA